MPQARRLRLVVLVHMALGHRPADGVADEVRMRERAVLSVAAAVVTTSAWTRRRLLELYALPGHRVHVAEPGVDAADLATGTAAGGALLCVAAVTSDKGHDVLLDALAKPDGPVLAVRVRGQPGPRPGVRRGSPSPLRGRRPGRPRVLPGATDRSRSRPQLRRRGPDGAGVARRGVRHGRHRGSGPRTAGRRSRRRRGAGGPRSRRDGIRPGLLVPPDDPAALGGRAQGVARRRRAERTACERAARERRESLPGWSTTTSVIAGVLAGASR